MNTLIPDIKIWPVEEMVHEDEFTDRVEILRKLDQWIAAIQRMAAPSTALIAPRRIGKTVLLDRLVNTVFLKPEYKAVPFYFKMNREKRTLREFLLEYATTFFRQYLAYCEQDAMLFSNDSMSLNKLASLSTTHTASQMALEYIEQFLERYTSHDEEDALIHWDAFIRVLERLGSHSGIRVAVIIDEFQDMQTSVYNMPKELMDSKDRSEGYGAILLANTFDRQAQSRKAPMLVSGSAVTMVFRTVMGGPLGGRFDLMYMKPLSIPDGAALLHTTLKYYGKGKRSVLNWLCMPVPRWEATLITSTVWQPQNAKTKILLMSNLLNELSAMRLKTAKSTVSGGPILTITRT